MGWSGATEIFDRTVKEILEFDIKDEEKKRAIFVLLDALVDRDWDTICESGYWEDRHPLVMSVFKKFGWEPDDD